MLYRGSDIRMLNTNELLDQTVDGAKIPIIEVDFPDGESVEDYSYQYVSNFEEHITRRYNVGVTGGLTDSVPAATKFTKTRYPPGLVLYIDENVLPADVVEVQYDVEWFDANPGALAHVTTLHDGEIRSGGEIIGFLKEKENGLIVNEARDSQIESEATASRVTTERELVAFDSEIYLGDSVRRAAMFRGTTGVSPYKLLASISEMPGYRTGSGGVKDLDGGGYVAGVEDYREQAKILYDGVLDLVDFDRNELFLVAIDDFNGMDSSNAQIQYDNFRFVYNGTGFDDDYERNSFLLGWG